MSESAAKRSRSTVWTALWMVYRDEDEPSTEEDPVMWRGPRVFSSEARAQEWIAQELRAWLKAQGSAIPADELSAKALVDMWNGCHEDEHEAYYEELHTLVQGNYIPLLVSLEILETEIE